MGERARRRGRRAARGAAAARLAEAAGRFERAPIAAFARRAEDGRVPRGFGAALAFGPAP